ncbi:MAG TPA: ACT domain-containing protein, partial [Dehalococcoidia bacterium]|nr:ACT domain-containing protein [Dehalococcoidia bacterium]
MQITIRPSPSYSITLRLEYSNKAGMLGRIASAIGEAGGDIGAVDIVQILRDRITRDITINAADHRHSQEIIRRLRALPDVRVISVSDRTFLMHIGGKLEVCAKHPLRNRSDLSMAYTPGVGRVCLEVVDNPASVFNLTIKRNTIAIITDGSAVLGLGNLGPYGALPVMEGKAMIFKEFAGVDAFPICLDTHDPDEIVETTVRIAPVF